MPIPSQQRTGWPMGAREMREVLGFPGKLPDNAYAIVRRVGDYTVHLLPKHRANLRSPSRSAQAHRIMAECLGCGRLVPFGRLAQHEPACKGLKSHA